MSRTVGEGTNTVGPAGTHILETEIGDEVSLYDPKTEQVTVLNGTASDIWRLADGEHDVDEIVRLLAASYQVSPESIAREVSATVDRFIEAGLLES